MADLTKMKYRVISAHNPKTGESFLRPLVTDRNTMSMKRLVEYAKTASYVRGQQKDLEGLLGGFIEAMKDRAKAGYSINVNDWFIISGQLKGLVGNDRQLTAKNSYHVTITASKDLKVGIDNFSWTRVDDPGVTIKVDSVSSPNGVKDEIIKSRAIVATGKNLAYDAAWSDRIVATWTEGTETKTVELVPTEQSAAYLRFDWPEGLSSVTAGTEVLFTFLLHGSADGAEQQSTRTAVVRVVDPPVPPTPTLTGISPKLDPSKEWQSAQPGQEGDASLTVITGTGLAGCEFWIEYDDPDPEQGGRGAAEFVAELATDTRVEGTSFLQADWNAVMQVKKNGIIVAQHAFTPVQE